MGINKSCSHVATPKVNGLEAVPDTKSVHMLRHHSTSLPWCNLCTISGHRIQTGGNFTNSGKPREGKSLPMWRGDLS